MADNATVAGVRLRRRLDGCIAAQDARPALEHMALAEASAVLDDVLADTAALGGSAARMIADLSLLHRVRAMGLGDPVEELHACVALQILAYVIDPAAVAPQTYEEIGRAIAAGADTDLPTARLRALQGHASAVRAAWRRERDSGLADTFVRAFERLVEVAGQEVPNWPTRLLDLAVAFDQRYRLHEPHGALSDLEQGIRLADEAISAAAGDRDLLIRAHKIRAPMLMTRDELTPDSTDLVAAAVSFAALVDLTPHDHPEYRRHRANLEKMQHLLHTTQPPAGRPRQ
ncbi:hypothetical protein RB614_24025 [Phytohabitans sp. ZYX-F-186]|uniref:Uncharacterized protein n=1 Tax=Phytohabitans maris TaxID=3071409 RepID=A0ABU0ZKL3_9ACTN|nr:hypothetical protein [Phytohabitans sp. ZYX-F-186]MDQ7907593.1 hypothetical protein [Phytohabitans sp. ZYX-F-186]